jgi:hypothetical protein
MRRDVGDLDLVGAGVDLQHLGVAASCSTWYSAM